MSKLPKLDVPMERNLFFSSDVEHETISEITKSIIEINDHDRLLEGLYGVYGIEYKPDPILIYIDTTGGYVYPALGLVGVIENSVTPVHTIVTGAALSAGFLLLISGHRRFAHRYSTIMTHQNVLSIEGKHKDVAEDLEQSKRLHVMVDNYILKRTKMTKAQLKANFDKKIDEYISPERALKLGIIDEIIG